MPATAFSMARFWMLDQTSIPHILQTNANKIFPSLPNRWGTSVAEDVLHIILLDFLKQPRDQTMAILQDLKNQKPPLGDAGRVLPFYMS
jgi:hypothetical protein